MLIQHDLIRLFQAADITLWKRFSRGEALGQLTVNTDKAQKKEDLRNRIGQ